MVERIVRVPCGHSLREGNVRNSADIKPNLHRRRGACERLLSVPGRAPLWGTIAAGGDDNSDAAYRGRAMYAWNPPSADLMTMWLSTALS